MKYSKIHVKFQIHLVILLFASFAIGQVKTSPDDHFSIESQKIRLQTEQVQNDELDKRKMRMVGQMPLGHGYGIAVNGTIVYYSKYNVIEIASFADPLNIKILSRIRLPDRALEIVYQDNLLYVANFRCGVRIVDVSNPENPVELDDYQIDAEIHDISVVDGIIYLAAGKMGLTILDATDPTHITHLFTSGLNKDTYRINRFRDRSISQIVILASARIHGG